MYALLCEKRSILLYMLQAKIQGAIGIYSHECFDSLPSLIYPSLNSDHCPWHVAECEQPLSLSSDWKPTAHIQDSRQRTTHLQTAELAERQMSIKS